MEKGRLLYLLSRVSTNVLASAVLFLKGEMGGAITSIITSFSQLESFEVSETKMLPDSPVLSWRVLNTLGHSRILSFVKYPVE